MGDLGLSIMQWSSVGHGGSGDIAPFIRHWFTPLDFVLDIGCGPRKIIPWAVGLDRQRGLFAAPDVVRDIENLVEPVNIIGDAADLRRFSSNAVDAIFSSHCLEHFDRDDALAAVDVEWARVVKPNGLIVLYLPDGRVTQMVGIHQWHPTPEDFADVCDGWARLIWEPYQALPANQVVGSLCHSFLLALRKPACSTNL